MTSAGLTNFKDLLVATREREREIREDMGRAKRQLIISYIGRGLAILTLASALSKRVREKTANALALRKSDISTLNHNLSASTISVSFDMETEVACPHREMIASFERLMMSQKAWSITTSQHINRVKARSVAGIVIARVATTLGRRADQLVDTQDQPLAVSIQRGKTTAFFYPGFVLVVENATRAFGVIDLKDLDISHSSTHFTETEHVPGDAVMVGKAWAKSNKDGSRDRRFRDNRELPVMLYGEITMRAEGGLDEVLMFSDHDACQKFSAAVLILKEMLTVQARKNSVSGRSDLLRML